MEFNIALHTIFYISVFIIPGILFRRFYFSGEFNKEFSQGNLMERFMWTIFSSIIVLLLSTLFFYFIRSFYDKELLSAISYETIKEIFDLLSENDLPTSDQFFAIYQDFLILLIGIYVSSIILGSLTKRIAISQSIFTFLPVLRYKNYWYYFVRGRTKIAPRETGMEYWYTEADVLVQHEGESKMYSGKISDYYINPNNNQLESVFLEDTVRYRFKDSGEYDLVPIPGHTFCIPFERVLNMNLTYVNKKKGSSWWLNAIWWFLQILYYSVVFTLVSFLFLEDLSFLPFESIIYKLSFCLNSWTMVLWLKTIFQNLLPLKDKELEKGWFPPYLIGLAMGFIQFLWIFKIYTFWSTFGFAVIVFFIMTVAFVKVEKKEVEDEEPESNDV